MIRALAAFFVANVLWAQAPSRAPVSENAVVELDGEIAKAQLSAGTHMPALELRARERTARIFLGPMWFLIDNDFKPKAGDRARVKAYETKDGLVAIEVTLPADKRTLRFRDENGWPVWRGGRNRRGAR
jgi:hypothetical protein